MDREATAIPLATQKAKKSTHQQKSRSRRLRSLTVDPNWHIPPQPMAYRVLGLVRFYSTTTEPASNVELEKGDLTNFATIHYGTISSCNHEDSSTGDIS
jgi:hypothetical protein